MEVTHIPEKRFDMAKETSRGEGEAEGGYMAGSTGTPPGRVVLCRGWGNRFSGLMIQNSDRLTMEKWSDIKQGERVKLKRGG